MADYKEISNIIDSIEETFQIQNEEMLEKKKMLTTHLGEFKEEIEALDHVLQKNRTLISFSKVIKILDSKEIQLLVYIATCNTKSELYRKGFKNSDPYHHESWKIINFLEKLNLIKIHRDETTRSVLFFECLLPKDVIDDIL